MRRRCHGCRRLLAVTKFRAKCDKREPRGIGRAPLCRECEARALRAKRARRGHIALSAKRMLGMQVYEGDFAMTFQEIADALGLSRGRIQQLEMTGMRKLRKGLTRLLRNEVRQMGARDVVALVFQ